MKAYGQRQKIVIALLRNIWSTIILSDLKRGEYSYINLKLSECRTLNEMKVINMGFHRKMSYL